MRPYRIIAASCILVGMACGDDGSGPPPVSPPTISSIAPTSGVPGDTLLVTGTNFATPAANNTVTFNNPGSESKAVWSTATQLRVLVDRDALNGPVTVTTGGGSAKSSQSIAV